MGERFLLHTNGIKLAKKDGLFGKSDPFVVIKHQGRPIAFSDVVMKNLNPFWKPILVDLKVCGGMEGKIVVEVYDYDDDGGHDLIGTFECTTRELISSINRQWELRTAKSRKSQGKFVVTRADVDNSPPAQAFMFSFSATKLAKKDGPFQKSDPFLMIYKKSQIENDPLCVITKTEYIKQCLSPKWAPFELSVETCGGLDNELILRVYDWDADGGHDLIGDVASTSLRQLAYSAPTFPLLENHRVGTIGYRNSGILTVTSATPTQPTINYNIAKVTVQFRARNLSSKDFLAKSDPYLVVKTAENFSVKQTEWVKQDLNPVWPPFELEVNACGGLDHMLTFQVWDHDEKTDDDYHGECKFSIRHLTFYQKNPVWRLVNPKKRSNIGYSNSGLLEVVSLQLHYGNDQRLLQQNSQPQFNNISQGNMMTMQPQGNMMNMQSGFMPPLHGYPQQPMLQHQGSFVQQPGYYPPQSGFYPPQPMAQYPSQMYPQQGGQYYQSGQPPMMPMANQYPPQPMYPQQPQPGYPSQVYPLQQQHSQPILQSQGSFVQQPGYYPPVPGAMIGDWQTE